MLGGWRGSGLAGQGGGFANFFDDRGFLADPPFWPCLTINQPHSLIPYA